MSPDISSTVERLGDEGYALLAGVYAPATVVDIRESLLGAFGSAPEAAIRADGGGVYAGRNVIDLWRPSADVWREPVLMAALEAVLGPRFGLVRGLYFDKPPDRSWALPWHKDLTIAVQQHPAGLRGKTTVGGFRHPTRKAGVPHVEAPVELLREMLTVRIHLDDVTAENGPLLVAPGSHRTGKSLEPVAAAVPVLATAGDVLLMRPLVTHSSPSSRPGTTRHRRILHLEFAPAPELPAGFAWFWYVPGQKAG